MVPLTPLASDDPDKVFPFLTLPGDLQHIVIKALIGEKGESTIVDKFKRERESLLSMLHGKHLDISISRLIKVSPSTLVATVAALGGTHSLLTWDMADKKNKALALWLTSNRLGLLSEIKPSTSGLALTMQDNVFRKASPILRHSKGARLYMGGKFDFSILASNLPSVPLQELVLAGGWQHFLRGGESLFRALGSCSTLKALCLDFHKHEGKSQVEVASLESLHLPSRLEKLELRISGSDPFPGLSELLSDRCPSTLRELAIKPYKPLNTLALLPSESPCYSKLTRLDLCSLKDVSDFGLLEKMTSLEILTLDNSSCSLNAKLWTHLPKKLAVLSLGKCSLGFTSDSGFGSGSVEDAEIKDFASRHPSLRFLRHAASPLFTLMTGTGSSSIPVAIGKLKALIGPDAEQFKLDPSRKHEACEFERVTEITPREYHDFDDYSDYDDYWGYNDYDGYSSSDDYWGYSD